MFYLVGFLGNDTISVLSNKWNLLSNIDEFYLNYA